MEKFVFTRKSDGSLTANDATKAQLGQAFWRTGGTLPYDVVNAASTELAHKTRDLMFTSGKSYEECSKHLQKQDAWLSLASAPIGGPNSGRDLGVEIVGGAGA